MFFSNIHTQIFINILKRGKSKQNRVNAENAKLRWAAARAAATAPQNGPGGLGVQQQQQQVEEGPAAASGAAMEVDASLESAQALRPGRL